MVAPSGQWLVSLGSALKAVFAHVHGVAAIVGVCFGVAGREEFDDDVLTRIGIGCVRQNASHRLPQLEIPPGRMCPWQETDLPVEMRARIVIQRPVLEMLQKLSPLL